MVGVRKGKKLLCGITACLVITTGIFVTFQLAIDPQTDLQKVIANYQQYLGCLQPGLQKLQMISTSNKTILKTPWKETAETLLICAGLNYGPIEDLPRASVIVTFHDRETISSLLHTIHSVIQRTPCPLLQEIIVIDDFSQKDDLGMILDVYIRRVFSRQVKLFRISENIGLIRSRLKGARLSQGEVIIFMDSHSEVQPGWLEPLLYEIKKNRKTLAHSYIDWMSKSTAGVWEYERGGSDWIVYFDWRLGFGWQTMSNEEKSKRKATDPVKVKVIIGAYAAIDRRFFKHIGELDDGMEFWGGENIDLSIRVWLFGGHVVSVPCSRVAHLEGQHLRDYRSNFSSLIERNYKRVVEVWFDEYKTYFYQYYPTLIPVDPGNLEARMKVKARAKYNFSWYLQNVYPELGLPDKDSFAWGRLKNQQKVLRCLDYNAEVGWRWCDSARTYQLFYWSKKFELRQPINIFNVESEKQRKVLNCFEYIMFYDNDYGSKWIHWKNGPVMEKESGLCLSLTPDLMKVAMLPCDYERNQDQVWEFEHYTDQYFEMIAGNRLSIENQYKKLLSNLLSLKSASSIQVSPMPEWDPRNKSEPRASEASKKAPHHEFKSISRTPD